MNPRVSWAIFKRNFVSYLSNPTGYVFICVFVLLTGLAAFWPNEFFNSNLANLDQLNKYLPYIMLVFIPAITMSIWAEERRQGTDELLLTIPASDLDVVLGKYLAAVAIFTAALLFSMFSNLAVLFTLGQPDLGLFLGTYLGYWFLGLAMLAIGMVASFLTGNLTVGFILGAIFNAPLVFAAWGDTMFGSLGTYFTASTWMQRIASGIGAAIQNSSFAAQVLQFGRGVISLSGLTYFLTIVAVMLYLSMVLIGRRHWLGGRDGHSMLGHYVTRSLMLAVIAIGLTVLFTNHDLLRLDVTEERLSSLSPATKKLVSELSDKRPVMIEAYISPAVPDAYVETRLNLISTLDEIRALGGGKVRVQVHDTPNHSEAAEEAEQQYNITSRQVQSRSRGAYKPDDIYMGLAVISGLEKVVVPFFDRGIPVEYELVRSIATVAQSERKKIGVVTTDARLFGGFDMSSQGMRQDERLIEELRKQYEVVQVDASSPITERYDALLAVQPSSLNPNQMTNFVAAIRGGQPTAIFEDPFPTDGSVPATSQPKRPAGGMAGMFGGMQPPEPKGDIRQLWDLLGVEFTGDRVIWQEYNPYPMFQFVDEIVFVGEGSGAPEPFSEQDEISKGLQQVVLLFPGSVRQRNASTLNFTPLLTTSDKSGMIEYDDIMEQQMMAQRMRSEMDLKIAHRPTRERYILAAHIHGKLASDNLPMADEGSPLLAQAAPDAPATKDTEKSAAAAEKKSDAQTAELNVVLVSDIDFIGSQFFDIRTRGNDPDAPVNMQFDNVTFVLNTLDKLAGDARFIDIRKRRPAHRTLTTIEDKTALARGSATAAVSEAVKASTEAKSKAQAQFSERIAAAGKQNGGVLEQLQNEQIIRQTYQRRLDSENERLQRELERKIQQIERGLDRQVRQVQDRFKLLAVSVPPILPLLMGVLVFFNRRAREREGVSKSRLR